MGMAIDMATFFLEIQLDYSKYRDIVRRAHKYTIDLRFLFIITVILTSTNYGLVSESGNAYPMHDYSGFRRVLNNALCLMEIYPYCI